MLPRFKDLYKTKIVPELKKELGFKNVMQVPRLVKIILSMGVKDAVAESKAVENAAKELTLISGQKVLTTQARKSIASFKLRKGLPIGCKVQSLFGIRESTFMCHRQQSPFNSLHPTS